MCTKMVNSNFLSLLLFYDFGKSTKTKAIIGEVLTEIPNLPCSYTSQYKEKWHFRNKTFF